MLPYRVVYRRENLFNLIIAAIRHELIILDDRSNRINSRPKTRSSQRLKSRISLVGDFFAARYAEESKEKKSSQGKKKKNTKNVHMSMI